MRQIPGDKDDNNINTYMISHTSLKIHVEAQQKNSFGVILKGKKRQRFRGVHLIELI